MKEAVFKKLFSKESYTEKRIINLMFDLTRAIEDFIAYSTLKKDEIEFSLSLSKGYLEKKLSKHSMRVNKLIEKKLIPGFSPGKDYISKFRRLAYLKSAYYADVNDYENIIECKKNYFEAAAVQFIIDYTQIAISQQPAIDTYGKKLENNFIQSIFQCFDFEKLLKLMEKDDYIYKPLIAIHY
jgi:hypothetical protein